jgi:hypothetical protein
MIEFVRIFCTRSWFVRRLLLYSLWVRLVVWLSPFEGH